jgi:hypothetical protein
MKTDSQLFPPKKFKQCWSTIPPISAKQINNSHIKSFLAADFGLDT